METYTITSAFTLRQVQNTAFNVLMAYASCSITMKRNNEEIKLIESKKTMDPKLVSITFGNNMPNLFEYPEDIGKFVDTIPYTFEDFVTENNLVLGENVEINITNTGAEPGITSFWDSLFDEDTEWYDESISKEMTKYMDKYKIVKKQNKQVMSQKELQNKFAQFAKSDHNKMFIVHLAAINDHIGEYSHIHICVDKAIFYAGVAFILTIYRPDLPDAPLMGNPLMKTSINDANKMLIEMCKFAIDILRKITDNKIVLSYCTEEE